MNKSTTGPKLKKVTVTHTHQEVKGKKASVLQAPKQRLIHGVTTDLTQSEAISGALAILPPLMATKVHQHPDIETILFIIEGQAVTLVGPDLEPTFHGPGEFVYIPKNVIHVGVNLSHQKRIVILEIRTDPKFDGVKLHPELEPKAAKIIKKLQTKYADGSLELPGHWADIGHGPFDYKEHGSD